MGAKRRRIEAALKAKAALDTNHDETKIRISDEQLAKLRLKRHEFPGDWNYTLSPRK